MGPAGPGPGPPLDRRVPHPLRLELDPREHGQRRAAHHLATLRGAEDERSHADPGHQGGPEAEGRRGDRPGGEGRDLPGREGPDGGRRREEDPEPHEGPQGRVGQGARRGRVLRQGALRADSQVEGQIRKLASPESHRLTSRILSFSCLIVLASSEVSHPSIKLGSGASGVAGKNC